MLKLTMEQIKELAEFTGMVVDASGFDAENMSDEYVITECPKEGIRCDGEGDVPMAHYGLIAYIADYPEEGCIGLGPELSPNV